MMNTQQPDPLQETNCDQTQSNAEPEPPRPARLRGDRNFNLFWASQGFDAIGDSASVIIIPLLVLEATGSVAQMGLITGSMGISTLIASLFSGIVVDRVNRRQLMIVCDIGRALVFALIPLTWLLMGQAVWLLYGVSAAAAILTTFFLITYTTVVPNIVEPDQISDANGRLEATVAGSAVFGPVVAGFSSKQFGPGMSLLIVVAAYLVSALLMSLVRLRNESNAGQVSADAPDAAGSDSSRLGDLLAGIRFLMKHPVLRSVTLLLAGFVFVTDATLDLAIFYLKQGLYQSDFAIGIIFGVASIGAVTGGLLATTASRKWGFGACFMATLVLQSVATAAVGLTSSVVIISALATLFTFGITVRGVCTMTLRQKVTPDRLLGRVTSASWTIVLVLGPLGTMLATALAERAGVRAVLVLIGALGVLIALAGAFTAANSRQPEKESPRLSPAWDGGEKLSEAV